MWAKKEAKDQKPGALGAFVAQPYPTLASTRTPRQTKHPTPES